MNVTIERVPNSGVAHCQRDGCLNATQPFEHGTRKLVAAPIFDVAIASGQKTRRVVTFSVCYIHLADFQRSVNEQTDAAIK